MAKTRETSVSNTSTYFNGIDVYYILTLVKDLIVMHVKFWIYFFEAIVKTLLPQEEISVKGQAILITGTGHGIGKELALRYAALGAKVLCWDIHEKNNEQTVKEIKSAGGIAHAYVCNVMSRTEINELAEKMKKEHGFISVIINNAGIMPCHPLLQTTETEIRNMYEINVLAHFWIMQAFLPEMIEKNTGHFVALSSCAGLFGLKNLVPYCGTKFAVRGYMQALAEELRIANPENKIKLTTIHPYMVDTGLCKKPHFRFPKLMKLVTINEAATSIVNAQRTGLEEISVPRHFLYIDKIGRMIPKNCMRVVHDFLDAGVNSDL